jgi:hypothetical protein
MGRFFKKNIVQPTPQAVKDAARKYRDLVPVIAPPSSFFCPTLPVRDQGQNPDCTGFGTAGQQDRRVALDLPSAFQTSPLYIFIKGGGGPNGAVIGNILRALETYGICKESTFPISLLTDINNLPAIPPAADVEAASYRCGPFALVQTVDELKDAVSKTGPEGTGPAAVIGVAVYSNSFENAANGVILPPSSVPNDICLGYHEVCVDAFDDSKVTPAYPDAGYFRFPNSWGTEWGDPENPGYGWIHYSLVTNPDFMTEMWGSVDSINQPQPSPGPTGNTATATLTLVVDPAPLAITTSNLPSNEADTLYEFALEATGGVAPYAWSATGLPAGLSLDASAGMISGMPTTEGTYSVSVQVTDSNGQTAGAAFTLDITPAPVQTLTITTTSLPDAQVGQAYSAQVSATGGVVPYTFGATGLPDGLAIDSGSGVISGTPTATGTDTVTITVTDSAGSQAN